MDQKIITLAALHSAIRLMRNREITGVRNKTHFIRLLVQRICFFYIAIPADRDLGMELYLSKMPASIRIFSHGAQGFVCIIQHNNPIF